MSGSEPLIELGVAICTHNPDERLLRRTLTAVASQEIPPGLRVECVIVDNNSEPPIATLASVQSFLDRCPWARVVAAPTPGLSHARVAAIESTSASLLCFVDDDNEPSSDYLAAAWRILSRYECIGVIGPGRIDVDFVDPAPDWFVQRFSHHFQEKNYPGLAYGSVGGTWTDYYPPGSCMVVRRAALERYRSRFLAGEMWASDRVGASLSSGGDTQIVWEAVKMGLAAGISSDLRIAHMIPAKRSNLPYIKRLVFGTSSSYLPALVSSFPEVKATLPHIPSEAQILWAAFKITLRHIARMKVNVLPIALSLLFGSHVGMLRAAGIGDRKWINRCVKLLGLT